MYRQNGLYMIIEIRTVRIRIKTFHLKRNPMALFRDLFRRTRGIPPSKVPTGQINLQNHGSPKPVISTTNKGSRITKTLRITNLKYRKNFSPGNFLIFFIK